MENNNNTIAAALITFAIVIIVFGPLALIWAMNTLFGLTIEYGFFQWLAAAILAGAVKANVTVNK
jgi:hypothetical protein